MIRYIFNFSVVCYLMVANAYASPSEELCNTSKSLRGYVTNVMVNYHGTDEVSFYLRPQDSEAFYVLKSQYKSDNPTGKMIYASLMTSFWGGYTVLVNCRTAPSIVSSVSIFDN